jgi:hypothetical protein
MAVRSLNGTSDYIRFPGVNLNAQIVAAVVKMTDTTVPVGWQSLLSSADASTHAQVTAYIRGTAGTGAVQQGNMHYDSTLTSSATGTAATRAIVNPAAWAILVWTKEIGSSTARLHRFPLGGAWSQEAGDFSTGAPTSQAGGKLYLGAYPDPSTAALGDFLNARVAVLAVSATNVSGVDDTARDTAVRALSSTLSTAAWISLGYFTNLWEFSQASTATTVSDLIGSNHQDAISGTSVVTGDDPSGWTFASSGGGGGASPPRTFNAIPFIGGGF